MSAESSGRYDGTGAIHWVTAPSLSRCSLSAGVGWHAAQPGRCKPMPSQPSGFCRAAVFGLWRGSWTPPPSPNGALATPCCSRDACAVLHSLFALPLSGWMYNSSVGFRFVKLICDRASLTGPTRPRRRLAGDALVAGWILTGLIGIHVAAALYHQFVTRPGLQRMLLAFDCRETEADMIRKRCSRWHFRHRR